MSHRVEPLPDTLKVREFMTATGQQVRETPTADITAEERLLRGKLVIEEALELLEALGLIVSALPENNGLVTAKAVTVQIDEFATIDLVEAADAIADITVVAKGTALTLGIPCDTIFDAVHKTNMAKLGPDGKPVLRPSDGKVTKPEGWVPPTQAIIDILDDGKADV